MKLSVVFVFYSCKRCDKRNVLFRDHSDQTTTDNTTEWIDLDEGVTLLDTK